MGFNLLGALGGASKRMLEVKDKKTDQQDKLNQLERQAQFALDNSKTLAEFQDGIRRRGEADRLKEQRAYNSSVVTDWGINNSNVKMRDLDGKEINSDTDQTGGTTDQTGKTVVGKKKGGGVPVTDSSSFYNYKPLEFDPTLFYGIAKKQATNNKGDLDKSIFDSIMLGHKKDHFLKESVYVRRGVSKNTMIPWNVRPESMNNFIDKTTGAINTLGQTFRTNQLNLLENYTPKDVYAGYTGGSTEDFIKNMTIKGIIPQSEQNLKFKNTRYAVSDDKMKIGADSILAYVGGSKVNNQITYAGSSTGKGSGALLYDVFKTVTRAVAGSTSMTEDASSVANQLINLMPRTGSIVSKSGKISPSDVVTVKEEYLSGLKFLSGHMRNSDTIEARESFFTLGKELFDSADSKIMQDIITQSDLNYLQVVQKENLRSDINLVSLIPGPMSQRLKVLQETIDQQVAAEEAEAERIAAGGKPKAVVTERPDDNTDDNTDVAADVNTDVVAGPELTSTSKIGRWFENKGNEYEQTKLDTQDAKELKNYEDEVARTVDTTVRQARSMWADRTIEDETLINDIVKQYKNEELSDEEVIMALNKVTGETTEIPTDMTRKTVELRKLAEAEQQLAETMEGLDEELINQASQNAFDIPIAEIAAFLDGKNLSAGEDLELTTALLEELKKLMSV